jgi:hypothetical protein
MTIPAMALTLVGQLTVAIAGDVPNFNVEPVCRGISRQGGLNLEPNRSVRQDYDSCIKSEMAGREQLVNQWSTFKASDKANCIGASSAGGVDLKSIRPSRPSPRPCGRAISGRTTASEAL